MSHCRRRCWHALLDAQVLLCIDFVSPAEHFTLVEEAELPFVIREHRRKFQWGVSHAMVWRRN